MKNPTRSATAHVNHEPVHWPEDDVPTVSPVIGDGDEARRIVRVGAWEFVASVGDDEPRIRDVDLAERLGYERQADVRDLVKRLVREEKLKDVHQVRTVRKWDGQVAARPVVEFWLTEAQALKVVAKSETAKADALLDEVIRVFVLARRGLLPQQTQSGGGAYSAATVAMAVEAARAIVAEMVIPLRDEMMKMRQDFASLPQGVITDMQADRIDGHIDYVALALMALGDATNKKSAMGTVREDLKAAIAWGFKGSRMRRMPAAKFAAAESALDVMRKNVDRRLKKGRKKVAAKKQTGLFDDDSNPAKRPN